MILTEWVPSWHSLPLLLVQCAGLYLCCQLAFDSVHCLLHRWQKSPVALLRRFSAMHQVHHDFYTEKLQLRPELCRANILYHHIPEYAVQIGVCLVLAPFVHPLVASGGLLYYTILFVGVLLNPMANPHHLNMSMGKAPPNHFFDCAAYHAYHHFFPDRYFSSGIRLFDWVFGTGAAFNKRRFAITGTGGAFGAELAKRIEQAGGIVIPLKWGKHVAPGRYDVADDILQNSDVLVLTHGSMGEDMEEALLHSYVGLIERFCYLKADSLQPPEVWALGSEIELHPAWGAVMTNYRRVKLAFAAHAKKYYDHDRILYRHIVPSAFRTAHYAKRPIPASWLAAMAMFFIRRGACYVPASISGLAFVNYLRFRWWQPQHHIS